MYAAELITYCDDCNRFHLSFYDYNEEGELMVGDTDGNWEHCDDEDLPSVEDIEAGSKAYLEEVARTGNDYLSQLYVGNLKRTAVWQISFRNWIGSSQYGIMFTGARRRGRGEWIRDPSKLPDYLTEFLLLKKCPGQANLWTCEEFTSIESLREDAKEVKWSRSKFPALEATGKVELEEMLPEVTVTRVTKQAAKQALERRI